MKICVTIFALRLRVEHVLNYFLNQILLLEICGKLYMNMLIVDYNLILTMGGCLT